ncbi:MAG: glycerol-3-phosphate 1-O-acyltransferase PlsY [Acidobacteriaceae bacterium]
MSWTYAATAVVAYMLGSIPFGYLLVRVFRKQDIRSLGSGNIGATNVARSGSKGLGIATLVLDALKGYVAVIVALRMNSMHQTEVSYTTSGQIFHVLMFPDLSIAMALAASFAIIGHVFPAWLRFKGGKGVATGLGVFLALAPKAVGIAVLVFAAVFLVSRFVSLASVISAAVFPVVAILMQRDTITRPVAFAMWFVAFVIILKHRANILRLADGTEPKFGAKARLA